MNVLEGTANKYRLAEFVAVVAGTYSGASIVDKLGMADGKLQVGLACIGVLVAVSSLHSLLTGTGIGWLNYTFSKGVQKVGAAILGLIGWAIFWFIPFVMHSDLLDMVTPNVFSLAIVVVWAPTWVAYRFADRVISRRTYDRQ